MLKLRLAIAGGLLLAGCTPGTYNVNVGVAPLTPAGSPATSAAPLASASSAPAASPAASAAPADVAQDHVTTFQQVGKGTRLAQTFLIKRDGQLTAVAVRLKDAAADRQPVLSIVAASGDRPGPDAPLASASVGLTPDASTWATATLSPPLAVKAGERYALVLTLAAPFAVYAGASLDTDYVDGTAFTGLTDGSTFWNKLGQDLAFRTTIQ